MAAPTAALSAQLSSAGNVTGSGVPTTAGLPVGSNPAPAGTVSAPNAVGTTNTNQASLSNFIQSYLSQYDTQAQGIMSSAQDAQTGLGKAVQGLQGQETSFNQGVQSGLQGAMSQQATTYGGTLFNTKAGPNGTSTNSVLLQQLQNDNTATLKQLQSSADAAMAQGDSQFANAIAGLQVQQYTMMLNAKESIYQGLASEGSSVAALSQAQTAQAQQQETQLNDMATLASKYGVTVQPGDSMADVINRVSPIASQQEQLTLGTMRASINESNAQAALAKAQASVISVSDPADINSLLTWYTDQPVGSQEQQQVGTQIGSILANNPKNAIAYAKAYNDYVSSGGSFDLHSKDGETKASTWAGIAQSSNLSVTDAINSYVVNNPGVPASQKADLTDYFYAAYGVQPLPANPWATAIGAAGSRLAIPFQSANLGSNDGKLNDYAKSVAEMGAQQFNRSNPQTANMPGANYYVNMVTGNKTTSYTDFVNQIQTQSNSNQ